MDNATSYFRHSGRFRPVGLVATCLVTAIAAVVIGGVYGVVEHYCPLIYGNIVLVVLAGFAIGTVAQRLLVGNHTRNPAIGLGVGLLAGLLVEYTAFVTWIMALSHYRVVIVEPFHLYGVLARLSEHGVWTIGHFGSGGNADPVSGVALITCWLVEAAIIAGIGASVPFRHLRDTAYCEDCGQWLVTKKSVLPFEVIRNPILLRKDLEAGKFSVLGDLKPLPLQAPSYSYFDLRSCTVCNNLHLLSVRNHILMATSKGKTKKTDTPVVHNMVIDQEFRDAIMALQHDGAPVPGAPAPTLAPSPPPPPGSPPPPPATASK